MKLSFISKKATPQQSWDSDLGLSWGHPLQNLIPVLQKSTLGFKVEILKTNRRLPLSKKLRDMLCPSWENNVTVARWAGELKKGPQTSVLNFKYLIWKARVKAALPCTTVWFPYILYDCRILLCDWLPYILCDAQQLAYLGQKKQLFWLLLSSLWSNTQHKQFKKGERGLSGLMG